MCYRITGIRHKIFNNLQISEIPQTIIHLSKTEVGHYLAQQNKFQIHVLCYSNQNAHEVNLWIKKKIIKTREKLAIGDILFLNNNITVSNHDDPFTPKTKLYNGDFVEVISVLNSVKIKPRKIKDKDIEITLKFKEIIVKVLETGKEIKILILLNYLENPQGELSKEEIIVFKILLNTYLQKELANHPFEKSVDYENLQKSEKYQLLVDEIENLKLKLKQGEKVKTQLNKKEKELRKLEKFHKKQHKYKIQQKLENDPSCEYFKLKNVAQVRYGWAMTVHKSMSYKWETVIFNADQGDNRGRTNKDYFQWLYTGITRATKQLILYGCDPITPLSNSHISMIDRSSQNIDRQWVESYFVATQDTELSNTLLGKLNSELHQYFNNLEPKDSIHLIDFCLFILSKLQENKLKINEIVHKPYQEIYEIVRDDKTARISIYYNKDDIFKKPSLQKFNDSEFGQIILHSLVQNKALSEIVLTKQDQWRENFYQNLINQLKVQELYVESLLEKDYHDLLRLFKENQVLCIKIDYNNKGFISTITAIYYTHPNLWDVFQSVLKEY